MTEFQYIAADSTGRRRRGSVAAVNSQEAYRSVRDLGLTPRRIRVTRTLWSVRSRGRITLLDIAAFTRELSVLTRAKVPLDQGLLGMIAHERNPAMRRMIREIASNISSGSTVTQALEPHRAAFGDIYIESLRAAEHSGALGPVCERLAEMLDARIESNQALKRALIYPVFVLGMVGVSLLVILMFVVPRFSQTFAASGIEMPMITKVVQALGIGLRTHWMIVLPAIAACITAAGFGLRSRRGRLLTEHALCRAPYFGELMASITAARFAGVLQLALGSGLGLLESIDLSAKATGRPLFVKECQVMLACIRRGESLARAINGSSYLPPFAERLISAGKDSSELIESCSVLAKHYDRKASHLVKNVQTIIEPLMTVAMAGIVLLVALSVLLPMWQMASSAGR